MDGLYYSGPLRVCMMSLFEGDEQGRHGSELYILEHIGNICHWNTAQIWMRRGRRVHSHIKQREGREGESADSSKRQAERSNIIQALLCAEEADQETAISLLLQIVHDLHGNERNCYSCNMRAAASAVHCSVVAIFLKLEASQ